jgi:hypothetical protein
LAQGGSFEFLGNLSFYGMSFRVIVLRSFPGIISPYLKEDEKEIHEIKVQH